MKRRGFMALISGAAVASPLAVRAQQADQLQRIGVLNSLAGTDLKGAGVKCRCARASRSALWLDIWCRVRNGIASARLF